jgi:hypothetical protein
VAKPTATVAGSLQTGNGESWILGSTWRWKALWAGKVVLFDEGAAEAVLNTLRKQGMTTSVRDWSLAWHAVDNAAAWWHHLE